VVVGVGVALGTVVKVKVVYIAQIECAAEIAYMVTVACIVEMNT
jgi:hypothetical protein